MDTNKIKIIQEFSAGSVSDHDLNRLFHWLNSEKGNGEIHQALDEYWHSLEDDENVVVESAKMLTNLRSRIENSRTTVTGFTIKRLLPYAAILILVFALAGILIHNYIQPAANVRTYATVIAENGQRSKVILPDSSVVWLNSGTTLSYNNDFALGSRDIYLTGQAFFDIRRMEQVPLLVHCDDLVVKVLGTKFDVSAYPDDKKINVVLESGSVQLLCEKAKNDTYLLKPGEMAEVDLDENKIVTGKVDIEKYTSWKNGFLIFKNDPMKQVIEKLERWYNIEVEVTDPAVYNSIFTGTIRNETLEQIMKLIEYSCPVSFQVQNNTGSIPKVRLKSKEK